MFVMIFVFVSLTPTSPTYPYYPPLPPPDAASCAAGSSTPWASGSAWPECPTLRLPGSPRALATTSWLVHPAALSTTARPSGPAGPPPRRPIGSVLGGAVGLVDAAEHLFEARRAPAHVVGPEHELGRALHARLARDRPLQAVTDLAEGLEDLRVVVHPAKGVVVDDGATEVGVGLDRHDRDQVEAVVVVALHLLREDLLEQLVQPRRARLLPCGAGRAAGALGHEIGREAGR